MSENTHNIADPEALAHILEDYGHWFAEALKRIFYDVTADQLENFKDPVSYRTWAAKASDTEWNAETLRTLDDIHDHLLRQCKTLINEAVKTGAAPPYDDFNALIEIYDSFINNIRRLERYSLFSTGAGALDPATGLRSRAMMEADLVREMSRLERQGKPFCLALVRIDHLDEIKRGQGEKAAEDCVLFTADVIKKSIRSFDDAYRLDESHFVLSLKQADMVGGVQALGRLKKQLEKQKMEVVVEGKPQPLSLSSCISEVAAGNSFDDLLMNLKNNLDSFVESEGAVLEYIEMSPLQRYVQGVKE
jgi:diguanylate cyclase (GGDEF)-like protein